MFTLDQIRCFVVVAEELHFGRAAERLQMTQPPLSRQIQKLERSLQVRLLDRHQRKVSLTPAGVVFLKSSRDLLSVAERAPLATRAVARGFEGSVHIGFTAAAGFGVLGEILTSIAETLPKVTIELSELVTGEQLDALRAGRIDLGLARPPFESDDIDSHLLLAEDLVLAVPESSHLGLGGREISEEDFRGLPLIMHSPTKARYFYDLIVGSFPIDHGSVMHTVSQITTMVSLVRAGRGAAFVPSSARFLGVQGVRYVDLDSRGDGVVELHAIWNRDNSNPALHRILAASNEI